MQINHKAVIKAVFIVPPKVHLLDMAGPAQIFQQAASNGAAVELSFCAIFKDKTESTSSCLLSFNKLIPFDQLRLNENDFVFVPGLESALFLDKKFLNESRPFQSWLRDQHRNKVKICSVCTGAFLVAAAGLLDGRLCTTHWEFTERLKQFHPKAKVQTNRLFVQEDGIYTSAGISSGIDLALYVVEQIWGSYFAALIAKEAVVYYRRSPDDPQLSVFVMYRNHLDHRIHEVQDILAQSLEHKPTIQHLADKVNMSKRNLTRLFKKTTQITITEYLHRLQSEHGGKLISEGHTVRAAALQCGFKSTNQLRHLLKRHRSPLPKSGD